MHNANMFVMPFARVHTSTHPQVEIGWSFVDTLYFVSVDEAAKKFEGLMKNKGNLTLIVLEVEGYGTQHYTSYCVTCTGGGPVILGEYKSLG